MVTTWEKQKAIREGTYQHEFKPQRCEHCNFWVELQEVSVGGKEVIPMGDCSVDHYTIGADSGEKCHGYEDRLLQPPTLDDSDFKVLCDYLDTAKEAISILFNDSAPWRKQRRMVMVAQRMLGLARTFGGNACPRCKGVGTYTYTSTATWRRGGISGRAMTDDICDECWGTGEINSTGTDIRKLEQELSNVEVAASLRWFKQHTGASLKTCRDHLPVVSEKLRRARWKGGFWEVRVAEIVANALDTMSKVESESLEDDLPLDK